MGYIFLQESSDLSLVSHNTSHGVSARISYYQLVCRRGNQNPEHGSRDRLMAGHARRLRSTGRTVDVGEADGRRR